MQVKKRKIFIYLVIISIIIVGSFLFLYEKPEEFVKPQPQMEVGQIEETTKTKQEEETKEKEEIINENENENNDDESADEESAEGDAKTVESIENRILLVVIENNFSLSQEIEEEYHKYKFFADMFLSDILKVDRKNLSDKSLVEIVDIYIEDYLAKQLKEAAKGYGKIIVLTDETASYDNFKKTLLNLNKENKIIDIILHLHGDKDGIYFYNQKILKSFIQKDFIVSKKPLNIGFVYQTVCYGEENMAIWLDLGAKVVSGPKGINNFVFWAPERFLNFWVEGEDYYNAVTKAFDFEVSNWKSFSKFLPGTVLEITEDKLENGRMLFLGEKGYNIK